MLKCRIAVKNIESPLNRSRIALESPSADAAFWAALRYILKVFLAWAHLPCGVPGAVVGETTWVSLEAFRNEVPSAEL